MKIGYAIALLVGVGASWAGCRGGSRAEAEELAVQQARVARLAERLTMADSDSVHAAPLARWVMPPELREISGLALLPDGRLLTHADEAGTVYVVDPRRGMILKRFALGNPMIRGDFEAIAVVSDTIYLLASNGTLYEFKEGADGAHVPFVKHDLKLKHECEFESLAYAADSAWLVMPCKVASKKSLDDHLVIYRWRPGRPDADALSMVTIPLVQLIGSNPWKGLHPTDMTIDPTTGNYVLIASPEMALIEMTPTGDVVKAGPLPGTHHQAEGVAISADGILMISDEATKTPASISLFRWRP